jgi:(hydroxyamino)benzene mutase
MNISLFRHAFVLILLALLGGFFIPAMAIPRLGVSAHTVGLLGGVLLIGVGAIWQHFQLSDVQKTVLKWSWLYANYVNWLGCIVGAIWGAGRTTPVAAAGRVGSEPAEAIVAILLVSVGLVSLLAVALSLWGLRPGTAATKLA